MRSAVAIFLLFASVFFIWEEMGLPAVLCIILAVLVAVQKPAERLGSNIHKDMVGAEGSGPDTGVWKEGINEMGKMAGEQAFTDDERATDLRKIKVTKLTAKPKKIGAASGKMIDLFKKLFQ